MSDLYLPPAGSAWERDPDPPDAAGLLAWARQHRSTAVLVVRDGRIAVEAYMALPDSDRSAAHRQFTVREPVDGAPPVEDVASAQKSVVSLLALAARERGLVDFEAPLSRYIGPGWSQAPPEHEGAVTLRHVMSMTSGLDDALKPAGAPGAVWHYNTPAYQLLIRALAAAAGATPEDVLRDWLATPIGMADTRWIERPQQTARGPMLGLATTARDLARVGLLVLNRGRWGVTQVVPEEAIDEATRPSQSFNPAYGLLWWLNAPCERHLVPRSVPGGAFMTVVDDEVPGRLAPSGSDRTVLMLGALNRMLLVDPATSTVAVRLGDGVSREDQASIVDGFVRVVGELA